MAKMTASLIGAGQRGAGAYAPYALEHPDEMAFVAVAEPDPARREEFRVAHGIAPEACFDSWEALLAKPRMSDALLVCTQDRMHCAPTIAALEKGYHVLIEKPMSPDPMECLEMGERAKRFERVIDVGHVLRYTPFFAGIKEILDSGRIGQPVSIDLVENVDFWHHAHSFVRGNWRNSRESSPMILAKSCHDMDILLWLMGSDCSHLSSFGSLSHFKAENAPAGAPAHCLDGCAHKDECPYFAPKIYLDWENWEADVIRKVVSIDTHPEAIREALRTGPYGRCVYRCDNDVVDHQVVDLEFENGATASFTMCAFTLAHGRTLKIMGTKGELIGNHAKNSVEVTTFLDWKTERISLDASSKGHGGGDEAIMRDFVSRVSSGGGTASRTSASQSVQSHLMAFAAEKSRLEHRTIDMLEYIGSLQS